MSLKRKIALAAGLAALLPLPAIANEPPELPGMGCLRTDVDGRLVDIPLKRTEFDAEVTGPVARVRVTQTFTNPHDETIEAVYVFPLPHEAAVSDFEMRIGSRKIRGDIERREEARRLYEEAKSSGKVAALLEQQRPNVFTQSVANILPGNDIEVTITYVETVRYRDGAWDLTFPTVVGPRFNPPGASFDVVPAGMPDDRGDRDDRDDDGFFRRFFPKDPDPDRLENPPVLPPGVRSSHDLVIRVDWDAGVPITGLESPTHRIDVNRRGDRSARVMLHPLDSIPNKDFVLRCRPRGDRLGTGVVSYHDGEDGFVSVLVHPKLDLDRRDVTAKEMVFVLDCSGSMSGEPISAAKALVRHALRHVNDNDTFQIIRFSEGASGLAPRPIAATSANVERGIAYLNQLQGEGGTHMLEGIRAALEFPRDPERVRMVLFLTDGYIGNEAQILEAIRARLGDARLFSFGVGGSVNRYLLDEMAHEGRGQVQYFLPGSSVNEEVARFYERIRNPYLTDVELVWHGVSVDDRCPAKSPDVFGGAPLAIHARYGRANADAWVEVRGRIAGRPWRERIALDLPQSRSGNPAVGALWARARIAELEREDLRGERRDVAAEITHLGLAHRLVTKYTSFVAIEERLIVSDGRPKTIRVPVEMPEGVSFEGVFGSNDAGGRGAPTSAPSLSSSLGALGYASPQTKSLRRGTPPVLREEDASPRPIEKEARPLPGTWSAPESRPAPAPGPSLGDAAGGVVLKASLESASLHVGETLVIRLVVENTGGREVRVPERLELADVLLRVIDSSWNESALGAPRSGPAVPRATRTLAPGATHRYTLRITAKEAAFLTKPGVVHLAIESAVLGSATPARLTLRITR